MRPATIAIALSLLIASGCGAPVAAADNSGDIAATCGSACAMESACEADKAECSDEAKAECAAACEDEAGVN